MKTAIRFASQRVFFPNLPAALFFTGIGRINVRSHKYKTTRLGGITPALSLCSVARLGGVLLRHRHFHALRRRLAGKFENSLGCIVARCLSGWDFRFKSRRGEGLPILQVRLVGNGHNKFASTIVVEKVTDAPAFAEIDANALQRPYLLYCRVVGGPYISRAKKKVKG